MQKHLTKQLSNGVSIKGSFKHGLRGCYIDLYIMSKDNIILATKTFTVAGELYDAQSALINGISKVELVMNKFKVNQLQEIKSLKKACPLVMLSAFPAIA